MAENGKDLTAEQGKTEIAKNDLKAKEELVNSLNDKIKELSNVDIEALKQEQFDLGKAEGNKEVEIFKKSIALEKALANSKAKDTKLLEKLIDSEKLKYEEKEGNYTITGLDEQLKSIKGSHSYLFEEEKTTEPTINLGGEHNNEPPKSNATNLAGALHEKYDK
jgi:hypothetical protein